jgi:hypothetical protein
MVEANQDPSGKDIHLKYRREEKKWGIIGAVIYSFVALFFTYWYTAFGGLALDHPESTSSMVWSLLFYYSFLLPVPLPIYLMLRNYLKKEKKSTLLSWSILFLYYGAVTVFALKIFSAI